MKARYLYSLFGGVVGLGVPLVGRLLQPHGWPVLYRYMAIEGISSFVLAGYFLGRQRDILQSERCTCQSTRSALNRLALTDSLTGLYNRRYLLEHLDQSLKESDRYDTPITCLMLDIDHFKGLNDAYGHPFGDFVLARIARIMAATVRKADIVGRYGGEEFLVCMPRLALDGAWLLAERIREAVARQPFFYKGDRVTVTVSIGLVEYRRLPDGWRSAPALIEAADQALYAAKRQGRNRCFIWGAKEGLATDVLEVLAFHGLGGKIPPDIVENHAYDDPRGENIPPVTVDATGVVNV